jgi:hypothetical protein
MPDPAQRGMKIDSPDFAIIELRPESPGPRHDHRARGTSGNTGPTLTRERGASTPDGSWRGANGRAPPRPVGTRRWPARSRRGLGLRAQSSLGVLKSAAAEWLTVQPPKRGCGPAAWSTAHRDALSRPARAGSGRRPRARTARWDRVAPLLRGAGHEVHAPTLTGLSERAHPTLQYENRAAVLVEGQEVVIRPVRTRGT